MPAVDSTTTARQASSKSSKRSASTSPKKHSFSSSSDSRLPNNFRYQKDNYQKDYSSTMDLAVESILKAKTYYEVLDVPTKCSFSDIRKHYLRRSRDVHPGMYPISISVYFKCT